MGIPLRRSGWRVDGKVEELRSQVSLKVTSQVDLEEECSWCVGVFLRVPSQKVFGCLPVGKVTSATA